MAEPFASLTDFEDALGRALTSAEEGKAESALRYASNLVRAIAPRVDAITPTPEQVVDVVVSLAERRFLARRDNVKSWTKGPFAESYGDTEMFTTEERLLLGSVLGYSGNVTTSLAGPDPIVATGI